MNILSKAWDRWKIIGGVVGNYQGRTIILVFYFTIMVPFGLIMALFGDPMRIKRRGKAASGGAWVDREPVSTSVEDARKQF